MLLLNQTKSIAEIQEFPIKMCNFAKKYSSHERRLLNFAYLCNVAENPSQHDIGSV